MTIIMGIDPGSRITGVGIIRKEGQRLTHLLSANIVLPTDVLSVKLRYLFDELGGYLRQYAPEEVAIESVFVHKNAQSALKLGHARGVAMLASELHVASVFEYTARQIKQAVVGYGGGQKEQVQHMVRHLLQLASLPASDAADALAVAVCHANTQGGMLKAIGATRFRRGRFR